MKRNCFLFSALLSVFLGACAEPQTPKDPNSTGLVLNTADSATQTKKLWRMQVTGALTDLALSGNGKFVLVATAPEPDVALPSDHPLIYRVGSRGKVIWKKSLKIRVKSVAISKDGSVSYVSTYDDQITAYSPSGKKLWWVEDTCQPIALSDSQNMLCYHDDDSEPQIAFEIYDRRGEKVFTFPVQKDVVGFRISRDERMIALALAGGQILFLNRENTGYKWIWKAQVQGEVVDLAISSGNPELGVIFDSQLTKSESLKKPIQKIAIFDSSGKLNGMRILETPVQKIEAAPSGLGWVTYGNGKSGQRIGYYSNTLAQLWERGDSHPSDYTSTLMATGSDFVMGFQSPSEDGTKRNLVLGFDLSGNLKWKAQPSTEPGAYLYSFDLERQSRTLVVGTDDGFISGYRF